MVDNKIAQKTYHVRSFVFAQCASAMLNLERHAWNVQLDQPLADMDPEVTRASDICVSYLHGAMMDWIQSADLMHDDESASSLFKESNPARSLKNLLFGTLVYMECLMMAKRLIDIEYGDESALASMSLLARKIEMLLPPVYGRRRCGIELMTWLLRHIEDRKEFCAYIDECVYNATDDIIQIGRQKSVAPLFFSKPTDWIKRRVARMAVSSIEKSSSIGDDIYDETKQPFGTALETKTMFKTFSTLFIRRIIGKSLSEDDVSESDESDLTESFKLSIRLTKN